MTVDQRFDIEREPRGGRGFQKLFRTALIIIPIGVLGNIAFSLAVTDRDTLAALVDFPRHYLLLALGLTLVPWVTGTLRLLIWTRFLGLGMRFREALQMTLAVDLGAAVSPTAVGGGLFKWGMLVQRGVKPGAAVSIATFPIIEDGVFFALAVPIAIILTESWDLPVFAALGARLEGNAPVAILVAIAIALLAWAAVRWVVTGGLGRRARSHSVRFLGRSRRRLRMTSRDSKAVFHIIITRGKGRFALSFLLTAIHWGARYSVISALVAFLGAPVQPLLFWLLQWVVFTIMSFVPTPGATGGAEAAFYFIYSALLPERIIGLATAGWRFLTFYFVLGAAAVVFFALNVWGRRSGRVRTN
jgi:uncharacterized protein (TIRG00374 family)